MSVAFTVGHEESYDRYMAETWPQGPKKMGRRGPPKEYLGGAVWRTPEEAQAFLDSGRGTLGPGFAVYEIRLPGTWNTDVSEKPDPDGYHRLLRDALIIRKVDTHGMGLKTANVE